MLFCTRITEKQGYKYRRFAWPRGFRYSWSGKGKGVLPPGMNVWVYSLLLLCLLAAPALAANPQVVYGGAAASFTASGAQPPSGETQPANSPQFSVWEGSRQVVPDTSFANGQTVTVNGLTVKLDASNYSTASVTASASSSCTVPGYAGANLIINDGPYTLVVPMDIVAAAPTLASVTVSPSSITGASAAQDVTLTATLSGPAPNGGATVTWSNAYAGGFAGSVSYNSAQTIPAGSTSCSETASVTASSGGGTVSFIGTYGTGLSATLTIGAAASPPPSSTPGPLYVYGAGTASYNGTYTYLQQYGGYPVWTLTGSHYNLYFYASVGWVINTNVSGDPPADYQQSGNQTGSSGPAGPTSPVSGGLGTGPGPTVSTTPPPTPPPASSSGAPGVSISASPYTIGAGGSSVLHWDTSGATTVTVTGVPNPSATGTVNVSPSQTTIYTVSATNSSGTNSQSVTVTVDASLPGPGGGSAFTPGSPVSSSGGSFSAPTLPGLTIPGVTLAGFGSLPPLTIPGVSLPPISLPGLSIPGVTAPGDLKIGIPGIGSIAIPTGWLTQLISAAINPASIAQQLATMNAAQFNSLATYNAGAAVTSAVNNGTATLQQINTVASQQTQAVINTTAQVTQATISTTASQTQDTINSAEKASVLDFQGMLLALMQQLFDPDPSVLNQFETEQTKFLDWGPYHFITAFQALLASPPADGTVGGVALGIPSLDVNTGADAAVTVNPANGVVSYQPGFSWSTTGAAPVPFDFAQVTTLPGWAFVRLLLGGGVWAIFIAGVFKALQPKQVF